MSLASASRWLSKGTSAAAKASLPGPGGGPGPGGKEVVGTGAVIGAGEEAAR